jgi:hypothetical protein
MVWRRTAKRKMIAGMVEVVIEVSDLSEGKKTGTKRPIR